MTIYHCLICGDATPKPIEALWFHLQPIDLGSDNFRTAKGTYRAFGLRAVICNFSPLLNTIIHWKYRYHRLVIPELDK